MIETNNLDTASIELSRLLIKEGVSRRTRGFDCIELPQPIMFCINDPHNRYVTIKNRKTSKSLPFGESLALLSGVNDIKLYSDFVPNMIQYSDDELTQRAGYGPRIRGFVGVNGEYRNFSPTNSILSKKEDNSFIFGSLPVVVDQFKYVVETLQRDPNSRQAVISITDPANDQFDFDTSEYNVIGLKTTKDIPCCRLLQFMIVDGSLNCTSYFRSNDLLFGLQQVNVFNNTLIQEVLACILGVPVGKYYHVANNLHYYTDKQDLIEINSKADLSHYNEGYSDWKGYQENFSLVEFDDSIKILFDYYKKLSNKETNVIQSFESKLFEDWAKVFYRFFTKDISVNFFNPYINKLFKRPKYIQGKEYVKVLIEGSWQFYDVYNPKAYIRKCHEDGKKAMYVGMVDEFGYLNN